MSLEVAFNEATYYLQDRSVEVAAYIPVPPLLRIIKDYYCSRLLFENAVFTMTRNHPEHKYLIGELVAHSTDPAVVTWKQYALGVQAARFNGYFSYLQKESHESRLSRIVDWARSHCARPNCWYSADGLYSCTCGWPTTTL
jgi:hypothetical protein